MEAVVEVAAAAVGVVVVVVLEVVVLEVVVVAAPAAVVVEEESSGDRCSLGCSPLLRLHAPDKLSAIQVGTKLVRTRSSKSSII